MYLPQAHYAVRGTARDAVLLAARILLASLFLIAGFDKATNLPAATAFMATSNVPLPELYASIAAAIELAGGAALVFGMVTQIVAPLFVVYVFLTAVIGHPYWTVVGPAHDNMLFHFWKNIAICGGFLLLAMEGAGTWSIDHQVITGLKDLHASTPTPATRTVRRVPE